MQQVLGGRYRVERLIGRDVLTDIYDATDLTLERRVTMQVLKEELDEEPAVRHLFSDAAQGATALLLCLALGLLAWHAYGLQRWGARPTTLEPGAPAPPAVGSLDLNRADRTQLLQSQSHRPQDDPAVLDFDLEPVPANGKAGARSEVGAALAGLGYAADEVRDVLRELPSDGDVEQLLRDALRLLATAS